MKSWMRDTFSPYFLATVLVLVMLALVGILAATLGANLGKAAEDLEVLTECVDPELVIEGCDKHGANCAPIYMCGGE